MKNSISDLLTAASAVKLPDSQVTVSNSVPSFAIVNSSNSKRLRFSKAMVTVLGLEDVADIAPLPDQGCVLIARKLPLDNVLKAKLKEDEGRKLSYSVSPIHALTELFDLNFAEHTSMCFQKIDFDKLDDGTPVAVVEVYNKYPCKSDEKE